MDSFFGVITESDLEMIKDYMIYSVIKKYGIYTELINNFPLSFVKTQNKKKLMVELFYESFGYYLELVYDSVFYDYKKNDIAISMFNKMKNFCINFLQLQKNLNLQQKLKP